MPLHPEHMTDLPPEARQEVGRAWNAYVRMRRAEHEAQQAKAEFSARLIRLRGAWRISMPRLGRILGLSKDMIQKWSAAYRDPTVKRQPRREDVKWPRRREHLAGERPAPGSEPVLARTERNVRALTDE